MTVSNTLIHRTDGMVYACPECNHAPVTIRDPDKAVYDPGFKYYCRGCSSGVNEVVEREARNNGGGRSAKHGLARKLEQMGESDVSTGES